MRRVRKNKKMLMIIIAAIVAILAIVLIINLVNKDDDTPVDTGTQEPVLLPETTYSDMQVKNVVMEYMQNIDKTKIRMEIHNTTQNKVEDENLTAMLIDSSQEVIGQAGTWIQYLDVGEEYKLEVILPGNLTTTTQIKLVKNQ